MGLNDANPTIYADKTLAPSRVALEICGNRGIVFASIQAVGDGGVIGTSVKVKGQDAVEGVNLLEGGRIGQAPAEAQLVDKKVPLGDELEQKVKAILMEKYGAVEK